MAELNLNDLNDLERRIGVYGGLNIDEAMELVAHIRELTSDRDSWCNQAADRLKDWDDMRQRAEAAEKRIRELEQDAARYRFLRDTAIQVQSYKMGNPNWLFGGMELRGPTFDAAIDAARKEKGHG
ncbi:hypothetical protein B551_0222550 [Cupriavidus sp. HPC(L)]|uniref:hypothetical protein n=1 Tax=Cupriavidus sp. HPC(L) TaxID=1217418 RepID=UPI00029140C8|nr:hypothetical protein [Cupriavidus sp. HPC(L)]ESH90754.1 hypothetical protein B551_0222550 [Cupriavidus sp. HPC(L)]